jgi:hypothetical protein
MQNFILTMTVRRTGFWFLSAAHVWSTVLRVQVATGQDCVVTDVQYGNVFNLMALHSSHGGYSLTTEWGDAYLINVCGPLDRTCNGREASVCLTTQANKSFAIGERSQGRSCLYRHRGGSTYHWATVLLQAMSTRRCCMTVVVCGSYCMERAVLLVAITALLLSYWCASMAAMWDNLKCSHG